MNNHKAEIVIDAVSENEAFARVVAAAFVTKLDPTIEEMADIKTAVSEAVTNSIIHAYDNKGGIIKIELEIKDDVFYVDVIDYGIGIENVKKAMEPMFTTLDSGERSGMGFVFMEAFMDELNVSSIVGEGTRVHMKKRIGSVSDTATEVALHGTKR